VRCQCCHVGEEGQPLAQFDLVSDTKRSKVVARQMMLMVQEINRRLDSLPAGIGAKPQVTLAAYRQPPQFDPANQEAKGRLQAIGKQP